LPTRCVCARQRGVCRTERPGAPAGGLAEPLCAALAVPRADGDRGARLLLAGDNRIGELVARVLRRAGYERLTVWKQREEPVHDRGAENVSI